MEGQAQPPRRRRRNHKGAFVKYVKKGSQKPGETAQAAEHTHAPKVILAAPVKSDEAGFTGEPKTWFNEEEYNRQFINTMEHKEGMDSYFGSYSHFGIHEEMLKDDVRTRTYMLACMNNPEQFAGKVVLDVGCGTGILSIFAARAGAKHVYGVDNAEIADFAKAIVKSNGLEDKVTIIKGKMEEIKLPVDKVDIIISEWMGYFLLFESMLDAVLLARDKYLRPDGLMLPDRVTLNMAAIEDGQYRQEKFGFWEDVYGVKMSCIKKIAISEPLVDGVARKHIVSSTQTFLDLDLYKTKVSDLSFAHKYELVMTRSDTIHGIVCWFDADFSKMKNPIRLSTSPFSKGTHWRQTIFYLQDPIRAKEGMKLVGSIAVKRSVVNFRDQDIKMSFHYADEVSKIDYKQMYKLR